MSKSRKSPVKNRKVLYKVSKESVKQSDFAKAHSQSVILNNFGTNAQFARDLGLELLKRTATSEHIETLKISIEGVKAFIELLEEKLKENKG